ncbi:MAG: AMP-binding protein, partial [Methyloligellaceae bacterium]
MGHKLGTKNVVHSPGNDHASKVLEIVQTLSKEVNPNYLKSQSVRLESDLDRDLGLDSLARAELIFRIDKEFGVKLPDKILVEATTPLDLLNALRNINPESSSQISNSKPIVSNLELVDEPITAETLIEVLDFHVERHHHRPHLDIWISENRQEQITYGELHDAALKVAFGLITLGILPGDRVAIMLGTSRDFFESFWGVLYSGAIPVPIYPPFRPSQVEDHLRRQAGILQNAGTKILIISKEMKSIGSLLFDLVADLENITTVFELTREGALGSPIQADGETIALMQYTSGSTGDPKGVVLTHSNLVANIRAMGQALEAGSSDVFVSWLPLYHDMGLIGAWLGSLYFGAFAVIMPPLAFLADPSRWLRIIHRYKATLSAGPNFAFELCCKNIRDEQIEGLDLSSLRLVVNGAEPVSPKTIENFYTRFAPYGFRREMMGPVYGLAENSVGLAFPPLGRRPLIDRVQRNLLTMEGRAVPTQDNDLTALAFVACGQPLPGHEVRIVDESGHELPERCEGELHFRGPSATSGYFRNQEKNESLFLDGWLVSGDRAYIDKGDIYITGRIKDMIIKAGRNIYPQEIEDIVGRMEGARKGCVAAISSMDTVTKSESLVLVVETRLTHDTERKNLRKQITEACTLKLETPPDVIKLVQPRTIPKTSSGKIRRAATRDLYEAGLLSSDQKRLWFQLFRLWISGLTNKIRRHIHSFKKWSFGLYWWLNLLILATITWLAVIFLPHR